MTNRIANTLDNDCVTLSVNEIPGSSNRPAQQGIPTTPVNEETANDIYKKMMTDGLLQAKKWISAAQHNLDIALVHVDQSDTPQIIPSFGRAERMRIVNRFFKIDDFPVSQRRQILIHIRYVYSTMLQIFERPGGLWGEKAFEIDSTGIAFKENKKTVAHTDISGYFKGGKPNQFQKKLRADSIYFVRENIGVLIANDKQGPGTIVHELAHFCGDERIGWKIVDYNAYGNPEDPKVARLTLDQRIRHADTYARFAIAVGR